MPIQQAVIGSCTNGRIDDLRAAAADPRGPQGGRLACAASSSRRLRKSTCSAMREGLVETFITAGCAVSTPTCGPCLGGHMGVSGRRRARRLHHEPQLCRPHGTRRVEVVLASPAVAAASAVAGCLADPRESVRRRLNDMVNGKVYKYGDNVDTDVIIPARYLNAPSPRGAGQALHGGHRRRVCHQGPAGRHHGRRLRISAAAPPGSTRPSPSRPAASAASSPPALRRIFYRNAINIGFPILECPAAAAGDPGRDDTVSVDFATGVITRRHHRPDLPGQRRSRRLFKRSSMPAAC